MTLDAVTDEDELVLIEQYVSQLKMIPQLNSDYERLKRSRAQARSQMAVDDAATSWLQMSHLVSHCLDMATDNLRALHSLHLGDEEERVRLYQFAQYPLLRAALESSSQALWMLKPESARSRVVRLLQARISEAEFDRDLAKESASPHPDDVKADRSGKQQHLRAALRIHNEHKAQISVIARRAGILETEYQSGFPGYAVVVREATDSATVRGYYGSTIWRIISGLTHPSSSRATHFSNMEEISESEDGIIHAKSTSDVRWAHLALLSTLSNYQEATALMRLRMLKPAGE